MFLGQTAALLGALGWAVSSSIVKPALPRVGAYRVNFVYIWAATALGLAAAAAMGLMSETFTIAAGPAWLLAGGALVGTSGDLALLRAISFEDVGRPFMTSMGLFMLFSTAGDWLLFHDAPSLWVWPGGFAILLGIYLSHVPQVGPGQRSVVLVKPRFRLAGSPSLFAAVAGFLWAASLLMTEKGLNGYSPIAANALANLGPAFAYTLWAVFSRKPRPVAMPKPDFWRVLVSGLLFGASVPGFIFALKLSNAGETSILMSTSPLFAVFLGWFFLKERPALRPLTGLALSMLGIFVVVGMS